MKEENSEIIIEGGIIKRVAVFRDVVGFPHEVLNVVISSVYIPA